jgi:hypothetical protein
MLSLLHGKHDCRAMQTFARQFHDNGGINETKRVNLSLLFVNFAKLVPLLANRQVKTAKA